MLSSQLPRIVVYHGFCGPDERNPEYVSVTALRRQLAYIRKNYRPMRLSELGRALATGKPLPPRTVAITIDDGYTDFLRWAYPLLKEFDVPATLFVVSSFPDTNQWIWPDRFRYLRDRSAGVPELAPGQSPATLAALKRMTVDERDRHIAELAQHAGVTFPQHVPDPYKLLSWAEITVLAASGLIEIGAHSRTHPIFTTLDAEQSWDEIQRARVELQQRLNIPVDCFCYPNGMKGDYRSDQMEMVGRAGYVCAVAAHIGYVTPAANRFALPRIGGQNDMTLFRKYLDGFEYLQQRLARPNSY